ncbi:MAG: tetratricopeptide repeat protein, partial [Acidobacteriota bacterium]|nr:tetratricopeptide repeat protein [Acidobacteriota bacterium]
MLPLALLLGMIAGASAEMRDPSAVSRQLSKEGRTAEALAVLERHLAADPADSDVRVLYGTMLSWEGRYPEAREQLERI